MAGDVDFRKQFVQQMARVQNAAARCGWSRGKQAQESLRTALTRAEEAYSALKFCGGPDPEDLAHAKERSGLDGWTAARQTHGLVEAGLRAEATRFSELAASVDPEHRLIAQAIARAPEDSTLAVEQLSAIVDDCTRTARARLHAAWWLATLAHVEVGHGRLLDMLDSAMSARDWVGAELAMRALRSHMEQRRLSIDSLPGAAQIPAIWPVEKERSAMEEPHEVDSWRYGDPFSAHASL